MSHGTVARNLSETVTIVTMPKKWSAEAGVVSTEAD